MKKPSSDLGHCSFFFDTTEAPRVKPRAMNFAGLSLFFTYTKVQSTAALVSAPYKSYGQGTRIILTMNTFELLFLFLCLSRHKNSALCSSQITTSVLHEIMFVVLDLFSFFKQHLLNSLNSALPFLLPSVDEITSNRAWGQHINMSHVFLEGQMRQLALHGSFSGG